ncbi:Rossmann-like domain-containing protein [Kaarinaea lacus]
MADSWKIYDLLIEKALSEASDTNVKQVNLGVTWTLCQTGSQQGDCIGLAMSPDQSSRTLPWSGTLRHRPINEIIPWIKSWNPFEAAIGLASINSVINCNTNSFLASAVPIAKNTSSNLAVFEHFLPQLKNKKVVVVGRYPGLERYESLLDLTVLERNPIEGDLPDPACEYVLPEADWVFLTANSIVNKTFPRLAELSRNAVTVLMGPSLPWLEAWREYGIDFLAGVQVSDSEMLLDVVAEGGGVRIFEQAVQYHVLDLSQSCMQQLKNSIADLVAQREQLKSEMDAWYMQNADNKPGRFPKWDILAQIDCQLSLLDLRFKRQWDARQSA